MCVRDLACNVFCIDRGRKGINGLVKVGRGMEGRKEGRK